MKIFLVTVCHDNVCYTKLQEFCQDERMNGKMHTDFHAGQANTQLLRVRKGSYWQYVLCDLFKWHLMAEGVQMCPARVTIIMVIISVPSNE